MDRATVIIHLARINRAVKSLNYVKELDPKDAPLFVQQQQLDMFAAWADEARQLWMVEQDQAMADAIQAIGRSLSVSWLLDNVELPGDLPGKLRSYLEIMEDLNRQIQEWHISAKGKHAALPDLLANNEAAKLLQRAVKAKILDRNYQPTANTQRYQLRMIADAIASILNLSKRNLYKPFHDLWGNDKYRLDSAYVPQKKSREIQEIKDLYPEYSFSDRNQIQQPMAFVTTRDTNTLAQIYNELVSKGHIEESTPIDTWMAICGKADPDQIKPIVWKTGTRNLCYFTNLLFGNDNRELLWRMVEACFIAPDGSKYNKGTMTTSKSFIWRTQNVSEYRPDLFYIANLR